MLKNKSKNNYISYKEAANIAKKLNNFYFCKDKNLKIKIFRNETISLVKKNDYEIFSYQELYQFFNKVENILKTYKGEIFYKEAECEFLDICYPLINSIGIEELKSCVNFLIKPYPGEFNYICEWYN